MDRIVIADYDPSWPERFEHLRSRIAEALGAMAAAIEHVGSTAVPGLAAKPIIDLDVLLRSSADLPGTIRSLESLGYKHVGDLGIPGREAFRAPATEVAHHLYVCPPESPEYRRHIAFRDFLRMHSEDVRAYAVFKRKLASDFGDDREGYTRRKTDFIEGILRRALEAEPFRHGERTMI
jgi:GrpB-like predicted nucleotidyltransferase (UPF0157 family)